MELSKYVNIEAEMGPCCVIWILCQGKDQTVDTASNPGALHQLGEVCGSGVSKPVSGSPAALGLAPPLSPCNLLATLLLMGSAPWVHLVFRGSEKEASISVEGGVEKGAVRQVDMEEIPSGMFGKVSVISQVETLGGSVRQKVLECLGMRITFLRLGGWGVCVGGGRGDEAGPVFRHLGCLHRRLGEIQELERLPCSLIRGRSCFYGHLSIGVPRTV